MGIPDHLSCLLRNLYAGQEAIVRTGHGTTEWLQIGKGVHQYCILSLCLCNLYAESVQFSCSVVSDFLQPHELQHARPPCPSPTPGVHPNICSSNEHAGLISFRMDWLDLLDVQGTLKSLLQHHSSKAPILHSAFFIVQLSLPCMVTGKTIALTRRIFVNKVMSLLFNMPSRSIITFLPSCNCVLISWLQSPSEVILEPRKIKSATVSTVSPSICHEVLGPDAMV